MALEQQKYDDDVIKPSMDVPTTYHPAKQNEGVRSSQATPETPDEHSVHCLQCAAPCLGKSAHPALQQLCDDLRG